MIIERPQITANTTWKDTTYAIFLNSKLKKSEEEIRKNKVITLQELKNHIDRLEGRFEANNI